MSNKFLLTAFSKDRPGIVADISQVIYENGYNLEDSNMAYLAGEFSILLLLSDPSMTGEDEVMSKLSVECRRLEREKGITAYIRPVESESHSPKTDVVVKNISVEGFDQAGIVYKVSRFLADANINILTLTSEVKRSPQSGESLYHMSLQVEVPAGLSIHKVEEGLEAIGDSLNVDVVMK